MKWIPVSKKRPKEKQSVYVCHETSNGMSKHPYLATYRDHNFFEAISDSLILGITHWCPVDKEEE